MFVVEFATRLNKKLLEASVMLLMSSLPPLPAPDAASVTVGTAVEKSICWRLPLRSFTIHLLSCASAGCKLKYTEKTKVLSSLRKFFGKCLCIVGMANDFWVLK